MRRRYQTTPEQPRRVLILVPHWSGLSFSRHPAQLGSGKRRREELAPTMEVSMAKKHTPPEFMVELLNVVGLKTVTLVPVTCASKGMFCALMQLVACYFPVMAYLAYLRVARILAPSFSALSTGRIRFGPSVFGWPLRSISCCVALPTRRESVSSFVQREASWSRGRGIWAGVRACSSRVDEDLNCICERSE